MGKRIRLTVMGVVLSAIPLILCVAANAAAHLTVENVTVVDKSENVVISDSTVSGNTISTNIIFHQINDNATFNIALKNSTGTSFKIIGDIYIQIKIFFRNNTAKRDTGNRKDNENRRKHSRIFLFA